MRHLGSILWLLLASSMGYSLAPAAERVCDIRTCGAVPGGETLCTAAIQKAIDQCAAAGGGTVYFPPGDWLSGTITLRSHITLELEAGCRLLGSANLADYPSHVPALRSYTDNYVDKSLIAGENVEHVSLVGRGIIDGQGSKFKWPRKMPPFEKDRPYLIRLVDCRDVLVEGIELRDSAMWMQHYLGCQRVAIRGIHVWNYRNQCNDGLDLDSCQDCTVSDSVFESDDDGITLKATCDRPTKNIVIANCIARSHCNAIKMGTESNGGFQNITITNCVVTSPPADAPVVNGEPRGHAGVALEMVDGGTLENITVSNLVIDGVKTPLFLRLGNRARPIGEGMPKPGVGVFRNVILSNIVATRVSALACSITGISGHPIENVQLANIHMTSEGGGEMKDAAINVPEPDAKYPDCAMFGHKLPAYGFYCRHVVGLKFRDVQLRTERPDLRPAIVADDVKGLVIDSLDVPATADAAAAIRLIGSPKAIVRNSGEIVVENK